MTPAIMATAAGLTATGSNKSGNAPDPQKCHTKPTAAEWNGAKPFTSSASEPPSSIRNPACRVSRRLNFDQDNRQALGI